MDFLNGNYKEIITELESKMQQASDEMNFEKAIEYRELLGSVRAVAQKQKITNTDGEDKDIIALARDERDAVVQVFFIRSGKLIGRDHFYLRIADGEEEQGILTSFVKQFYAGTPYIPREIVLQSEIEEEEVISEWLAKRKGQKVYLRVPKKERRNDW